MGCNVHDIEKKVVFYDINYDIKNKKLKLVNIFWYDSKL
jgi:hypothetical protein